MRFPRAKHNLYLASAGAFLLALIFFSDRLGLTKTGGSGRGKILLAAAGFTFLWFAFRLDFSQNWKQQLSHSIKHAYQGVAFVVFNVLLCLLAMEVFSSIGLRFVELNEPKTTQTTMEAYVGQPWYNDYAADIATAESRSGDFAYKYHPYIVWRKLPFKYRTISVDENGIRPTPGSDCVAGAYRVYFYGGSTMWGTGAPDWETIPANFLKELSKTRKGPLCVTNFGESAYVNNQEIVHLVLQLKNNPPPDLVIFYDGVNDTYTPYQTGKVEYHQNFAKIAEKFEKFDTKAIDIAKYGFNRTMTLISRLQHGSESGRQLWEGELKIDEMSDAIAENYRKNFEFVSHLSKIYGFQLHFFWQPSTLVESKPLSVDEKKAFANLRPKLIELFRAASVKVKALTQKEQGMHYISDVFNNTPQQAFIDNWHLTPFGNQTIAARMIELMNAKTKR